MVCIIDLANGSMFLKLAKSLEKTTVLGPLIEGLKLVIDMGISNLEIEGYSHIIINALKSGKTPNWRLNTRLEVSLTLINNFINVKFIVT